MAGNKKIGFDMAVYLSEMNTGDRNFALNYFLNDSKAFPENTNLKETIELYFQCCSMLVDVDTMSIIAATFANGGICPLTGEKVLSPDTVKYCLSLMASCGMYNYTGKFAFKVGLPAKSGVGGGLMAIIPNVMGICTFSPLLDEYGNSIRGVEFLTKLTKKFNFHNFDSLGNTSKKDPRKNLKRLNE